MRWLRGMRSIAILWSQAHKLLMVGVETERVKISWIPLPQMGQIVPHHAQSLALKQAKTESYFIYFLCHCPILIDSHRFHREKLLGTP